MTESTSFKINLTGLIKQDDVRAALEKVESNRGTDFDLKCATDCLIELQLLLSKGVNGGKDVNSSTNDIYELAKQCLSTIEISNWKCGNSRLLTCVFYLIKFFLSKDELSLGTGVCYILQRWTSYNSQLNDSERKILATICGTLNSYLYHIDLEKCLQANSASMKLLFDSCKIPCELLISDEVILKNSFLTFRKLIYEINLSNMKLNDSIHIESVSCVLRKYVNAGNSINNVSATFMAYLEVLHASIVYTADKKNYQELPHLLKLIDLSKDLFRHKNSQSCLNICRNLISLVLIDQGIVEESFRNLCSRSSNLLDELSSKNAELMSFLLVFIFKTVKKVPFEFKNRISAVPDFLSLIVTVFKIQKSIIDEQDVKTNEDMSNLIVCMNQILLKTFNLVKEFNYNEALLLSIFEVVEKVTDYTVDLLQYDHTSEVSLKNNCYGLVCNNFVVIHSYYKANMYDNALKLSLKLIDKLICLSCDATYHLPSKLKHSIYLVLLQCSTKTSNVENFLDVILATICNDPSSADELLGHLATLKKSEEFYDVDKSLTLSELLDKRKVSLVKKWKIPLSAMNVIKRTSTILSELKAYLKVQPAQGDLLMKVVENLMTSNPSLLDAAKGLVLVLDLSVKTYVDVGKIDKERLKIQENLRKQVKESGDFESLLLYGSLLHYSTLFKIYAIRKKVQVQTVRFKAHEAPQTLDETGMFSERPDSCGSVASELAFTNQQALIDELEKSFNYLKAAFRKIEGECNDFETYLEIAYSNIQLTAQLFTLYHLKEKAVDAWMFMYTLGERFSHQAMRISAVTHLLKLEARIDKSWIDNAMEIAVSLAEKSSERQHFYICLASSCIKSSQIADAVSHLTLVGAKFRNEKIRTHFFLTLGQVLLIPESATLWKGTPSSAVHALDKAFRHLYHLINNNDWEGFIDHCMLEETFLDTLMCLKRFFSSIMMPRLTYYYLNEQSSVVQKLALPLRLAELLISLAWVDVSVHKKDDCDLKLASIIGILGLEKKTHIIGDRTRSPVIRKRGLALASDDIGSANDGVCLATPGDQLRKRMAPPNMSPELCREQWSEIVLHSADCSCLGCRTPIFLNLTFDLLLLQAASYCIRRQFSQAIKYFDDAQKYLDFLGGKGINEDWLRGRQVVLYYFYNEMLISHKNFGAAALGVRKMIKIGTSGLFTEIYGVTVDHINLQIYNLKFHSLKNRLENKVEKVKPVTGQRYQLLAVPLHGATNERTPPKNSAVPSQLLLSSSKSTVNRLAPIQDRRNMLVFAKALDFGSDEENDIVNSSLVEKENNFVSPKLMKQKVRKNQLPSIVSQVPSVTKVPHRKKDSAKLSTKDLKKNDEISSVVKVLKEKNDTSKNKRSKPNSKFDICSDPPQSSSTSTSSVVNSQKAGKPKRTVRAVRK